LAGVVEAWLSSMRWMGSDCTVLGDWRAKLIFNERKNEVFGLGSQRGKQNEHRTTVKELCHKSWLMRRMPYLDDKV
jgi:hypothetical protein